MNDIIFTENFLQLLIGELYHEKERERSHKREKTTTIEKRDQNK